jgi:hypothetical protein
MSIVQKLTEGIVNRDLSAEGAALISKWEQTGLLEGLENDTLRNGMARLLENQAKELLREAASSMSGGDVQGFAAVAFPLVRRVFGSLIANDLVSVQPMSLPSGLIFFLDFTFGGTVDSATASRLGFEPGTSIYGGGKVGSQITGGLNLDGANGTSAQGPYNLRNGYASPTSSLGVGLIDPAASGTLGAGGAVSAAGAGAAPGVPGSQTGWGSFTEAYINTILRFDPELVSGSSWCIVDVDVSTANSQFNRQDLVAMAALPGAGYDSTAGTLIARLGALSRSAGDLDDVNGDIARVVIVTTGSAREAFNFANNMTLQIPIVDDFQAGGAVGSVQGDPLWGLENQDAIPEINIKVDSVAVTAVTKKLKAKWTPELGQDLNAYHNLDAEVELTQILSEQIALEIDREILEDLIVEARAGVRYWSRNPGQFLNRETGATLASGTADFTGNVSEWYETLVETINDVSAEIHRKTLRGAANFVVCSPEVANILEFTAGFRANVTADSDRGDIGTIKVGSLSKKFDVMVDPYFPRNVVLVGRRGSSFLESGYVYAPYVPLQTTPTIFGVEDFVPRKGVMTRYAKKMVRPDMYGLVVCKNLTNA